MGYFKARSSKKIFKRRAIIILIILFIVFLFIKLKINIKKEYLYKFSLLYLQIDGYQKKVNKKESTQKTISILESKPIIYIYNTHQSEAYIYNYDYNVNYDVLFASKMLKSLLDERGINSIVESTKIDKLLKKNNYNYSQSYLVSRQLLEQSIIDYPSLQLFIDIHRDSASYEVTTCSLDDGKYAKILFVIGLEHDNYKENLRLANNLNERIKKINQCLTRGIMKKSGEGVNGIYNQDFNENVLLIEVGGQYNSIEEVNNTLNVLATVIEKYIKENL